MQIHVYQKTNLPNLKGLIAIKKNHVFKAILLNPLVIVLYYYLCSLLLTYFDIGGTARRLPMLAMGFLGLFLWLGSGLLFRKKMGPFTNPYVLKLAPFYVVAALMALTGITVYTGLKATDLAQTWGTPLHWRIRQWRTETRIDLEGMNVFEQGIEGVLSAIDDEMDLPEKLYLRTDLDLRFDSSGDISSFSAIVYGQNESGEYEGFSIYTDSGSSEIIVSEQEIRSEPQEDQEMLLSPLMETVSRLSLAEVVEEWPDEDEFGIYYRGYRSWGYNSEAFYYIEDSGPVELMSAENEIEGYTVSVFVAGKTEEITPKRYIDRSFNAPVEQLRREEERVVELGPQTDEREQEIYFLTEDFGYRFPVIDAATGSRWYGFEQTNDGGLFWETVNPDPFDGRSGRTNGITFLDEDLGFSVLERGSQGTLFRTDNGGATFDEIGFPEVEVPLSEDEDYRPFQFPEMPYEVEGSLYVLVGQGAEGDYNMGVKALYQSEDSGQTWEIVEEADQ